MSPRSERLNESLRAESQSRILDSALELFAQHGFDRTSVTSIAKAAGISQGLIYHYYDSKDDILRALFERSITEVQASFDEAEIGRTPEEKIARLIRAALKVVQDHLSFWRLSYVLRMQPSVLATLGNNVQGWAHAIRERLTGYLQEAGVSEPELEAAILFALIDGIAQHYALDPENYPLDAVMQRVIHTYTTESPSRKGKEQS